jgi:putative nucleotidyltransferase with HDIG domain
MLQPTVLPSEEKIHELWEKYRVPEYKRKHMAIVARVALFFADRLTTTNPLSTINRELLHAAALLHDIDKNIQHRPDERHPDAGVRVLRDEGMEEVANLVATHPLHAILDPKIKPKTWEEKFLYLADKMIKQEIITVDKRFDLWRNERLPEEAYALLTSCYPDVKNLEREVFDIIGILPGDAANIAALAK